VDLAHWLIGQLVGQSANIMRVIKED